MITAIPTTTWGTQTFGASSANPKIQAVDDESDAEHNRDHHSSTTDADAAEQPLAFGDVENDSASSPPVTRHQRSGDAVVAYAIEDRCFSAHSRVVHAVELFDVDPRLSPLRVPAATADRDVVAITMVRLARHPNGVHPFVGLSADDEHRTIFAASVILFVGHPRPDHLSRIRCAVSRGRVGNVQIPNPLGIDLYGLTPPFTSRCDVGFRRARSSRSPLGRPGRLG